jgi:hypothetical protein
MSSTIAVHDFLSKFKEASHFIFAAVGRSFQDFLITTDQLMKDLQFSDEQRRGSVYLSFNREIIDIVEFIHMIFYDYICKRKELKQNYDTILIASKDTLKNTIDKIIENQELINLYLCSDTAGIPENMEYSTSKCFMVNLKPLFEKYYENVRKHTEQISQHSNPELQPISTSR